MSQGTPTRWRAQDPVQVRRFRVKARLTQRQLADAIGISDAQVCRIETGKSGASPDTLHLMAEKFGCEIDDLMARQPPLEEDSGPTGSEASPELIDQLCAEVEGLPAAVVEQLLAEVAAHRARQEAGQ